MVVNRKQPVVPAPPISRTASSQSAFTKRHMRSAKATPRDDQKPNGRRLTPSYLPPSTKLEKKRKSMNSIDLLILSLLSAFTWYSFYVCRPNPLFSSPTYESQPSLCRALATYRTHVLEPYVLPPIKQTLRYSHQISGPYVEGAQVRLSPYFKPVMDSLTPPAKSFISTTENLWKNTVVSIYTQSLRPYYETAVVPRYIRYVKPHLVPLQNKARKVFAFYVLNPIRLKTNFLLHALHQFYTLHVDTYVRNARPYADRFLDMTRAVAVRLSALYTSYLHPSSLKLWNAAHSTIFTPWKHFFNLFTDGMYTNVKWVTREVGAYRRQYVDRHVDRILEQVADSKTNGNLKETHNDSPSVVDSRIPSKARDLTTTADALESGLLSSPFPATTQLDSSASMPRVEVTPDIPVPTPHKSEIEEAMSIAEKTAEYASTVIDEFQEEFFTFLVSDITPTPTALISPSAPADDVSPAIETVVTVEPSPSPKQESDPDLEEFLRELGVGQQAETVSSTPDDTKEVTDDDAVIPDRPMSKEERLAETATKRADIVGRHDKWFERLYAGVQEIGDGLVRTLQSLRDVSAEELRSLRAHPSKVDPNEEPVKGTRSLTRLEQNGQKLIKGLEVYLRKAETRCNDWTIPKDSPDDEAKKLKQETASKEKEKFSDIVSKVEAKFSSNIDSSRLEIHNWYADLKEREAGEVLRASNVIKDLASRAQEDLAMDYAWLDDVTYLDWQRYHDLMRVHGHFDTTVRQIANGTSTDPTPPSDPVLEALDELDRDLQDIILGFNYALSGMRSRGFKVFSLRPLDDGGDDDNDDGFFIVRDNEKRVVDLRGVDLGNVELKKEAVGTLSLNQDGNNIESGEDSIGILPVPDVQTPGHSESEFDASKIIIGKGKVQIEEALRDIPLEPPVQRHAEL